MSDETAGSSQESVSYETTSEKLLLASIGDLVEDVVVHLRSDPRKGTDTPTSIVRRRGGSAANVAVLAADSDTPSRFIGQVGDDPLGIRLIEELRRHNVDTIVTTHGTTGSIVVLVDHKGERTFLTDRGAASKLAGVGPNVLDNVGVLHMPVYCLAADPLARTASRLAGDAVARNIPVTIDLSSTSVIEEFGHAELLSFIETLGPEVVFGNQQEHRSLRLGERDPVPGAGVTIIKGGAEPTLIIKPNGDVISVPVRPVANVLDTTGAGDAFAAGYLGALLNGSSPRGAVDGAHRLAARVLGSAGATLGS